jgi:ATP/maltotriose-dependent transcriptional regulator MalT
VRAQVLETKLRRPALPRHVVPRARFDAAIDATSARLVLVHAKAGAGKTTALTRYAQRSKTRVAWCSLDRADNDPERFFGHVAAAIGHHVGIEALDLLDDGDAPDAVAASFVADLRRLRAPVTLVIDDWHVIAEPYVYDTLDAIVRDAPADVRFVLAGRERPRLTAIEGARLHGDLLELDDATLRMSLDEAQAVLERVVGAPLDVSDVATLVERTEGWAAGIALAGFTLRDTHDRAEAIRHFSGSDRPVAEYLTHEVLEHQPRHLVQFLLDTSVLDRLEPDACAAVSGRDDASTMLRDMERRQLFVSRVAGNGTALHYDPLFRELLEDALRRTDHDRHRVLHRRAALWYEERGQPSAFEHWLEAGEVDRAWELFHAHAVSRLFAGGRATVARWTTLLPDRTEAIDVGRAVDLALALLYLGDAKDAGAWIAYAIDVLAGTRDVPDETRGRLEFTQFLLDLACGDLATSRTHAERALAILDRVAPGTWGQLRGSVAYVRVASLLGDFDAADAMYERAARESVPRTAVDSVVLPTARCELELSKGNLGKADALATQAIDAAARIASSSDPVTADAHYVRGTVLLERNDLVEAEQELRFAMQLGEAIGYVHSSLGPALSLARVWHLLGRAGGAWALVDEVRRHHGRPLPEVLVQRVEATCARLALLEGDIELARTHAVLADDRRRPRLLARVHAAAGEPERALEALERFVQRGKWERLDGLLVRARCAPSAEERAVALHEALVLGEADGYVRIFVDENRWISEPLRELVASWPTPYVARLVTALANEPDRPSPRAGTGALTERELEVWRYLSTPLSAREIADALFISRNTLKSHLRSIYRKLGASTRHDAVWRGRERLHGSVT